MKWLSNLAPTGCEFTFPITINLVASVTGAIYVRFGSVMLVADIGVAVVYIPVINVIIVCDPLIDNII